MIDEYKKIYNYARFDASENEAQMIEYYLERIRGKVGDVDDIRKMLNDLMTLITNLKRIINENKVKIMEYDLLAANQMEQKEIFDAWCKEAVSILNPN